MNSADQIMTYFRTEKTIIAGPCAIESKEQIHRISNKVADLGIKFLRGGAYKPRTCPESFQGLGFDGLKYIREAADKNDMYVVSEILDSCHIEAANKFIDVIQIGSRNMFSYGLLKEIGKATANDKKPILLKRAFNATLDEFLSAANYIINAGNPNIILCLRGIRSFEQISSGMRFTPDLSSILELREKADSRNLPVIFDPSHSTGHAKYVTAISKAALVLGADGLLIECHDRPKEALCDEQQCILPEELEKIIEYAKSLH